MAVQIKFGNEARQALLEGARKLNAVVSVTMGPAGRTVLFRHGNVLIPSKDGVTCAREVNLSDPFEAMGADFIKAAADQAVNEAGDGTTTATLLAYSIFEAGCKAIEGGAEATQLVRGIERATRAIIGEYDPEKKKFHGGILETFSVPITDELAFQAARIASNGDDKIAKVVTEAILKVGPDGALTPGNSNSPYHVLEFVDGLQFNAGMAHPYFMTEPQRGRCVYEDVTICLLNRRLSTASEAAAIMEKMIRSNQDKGRASYLLIMCDDIDPEAMNLIVQNKVRPGNGIPVVVVRNPLWGDQRRDLFDDLAVLTGGKRIEFMQGKDYAELKPSDFGKAQRVVIDHARTLIQTDISDFGREKRLKPHIAQIKAIIADEDQHPATIDAAKTRLAALTGGVAVIKVGGTSVNDVQEIKFRVEDAIHATRAAVADGVVPGGGSALLFAGDSDLDMGDTTLKEDEGIFLLLEVLSRPIQQIADNAGFRGDDVSANVNGANGNKRNRCGFDAKNGVLVPDMIAAGIVDPLRVVRAALNAATSAAATTLLKCEAVIAHEPVSDIPQNRR